MRAIGDNIARDHLPEHSYHRFHLHVDDGFHGSHVRVYEALVRESMEEAQGDHAVAERLAGRAVLARVLDQPLKHIAVSIPLFYRGIWIDEFAALSIPSLMALAVFALARRRWIWLVAVTPGLWSLFMYPLVTPNIPRYQLTAISSMAFALGWATIVLWTYWRSRKKVQAS